MKATIVRMICTVGALASGVAVLLLSLHRGLLFQVYSALRGFVNLLVENAIPEKALWVDLLFPIVTVAALAACSCALARKIPADRTRASQVSLAFATVLTLIAVYDLFRYRSAFIGTVLGGFGVVAGIWLYGKLQTACPAVFNHETVSYIVFGVLTTVVSFVSQMLFASLGTPAWVNTIGSWICAVTFAYIVNKRFVFCSHTDSAAAFLRELWLFFAARLASLGMELVFMFITVDMLHFSEAVCKLIAQMFILVANYIFSKLFIFRKRGE